MVTTTPPHIDRLANRFDGISPIAPYARAIFTCLSARSGFHTRTGSLHCRSGPADLRRKTAHRLLPRAALIAPPLPPVRGWWEPAHVAGSWRARGIAAAPGQT